MVQTPAILDLGWANWLICLGGSIHSGGQGGGHATPTPCRSLCALCALESDLELLQIGVGLLAVIAHAIDEVALGGTVAVAAPGEIFLLGMALADQLLGRRQIEIGAIDLFGGLRVPLIGFCSGIWPQRRIWVRYQIASE
jgi:hypothetical protein